MGYQTLETAGYGDGKLYGYAPAEFRKMCEDLGMQVMGAHLGRSYTKETDAEVMDWWKQALDAQAEAGCSYAVAGFVPDRRKTRRHQTLLRLLQPGGRRGQETRAAFRFP
ncbi:hypothetical protein [Alistipes indistinctus]|uniref:hypothetical protein n=1 Tax=Alistipes indistinctus TaxID=626932 RepID=UPI00352287B5